MSLRTTSFFSLLLLIAAQPSMATDLSKTSGSTSCSTYAWIVSVGEDSDTDQGPTSSDSYSSVEDTGPNMYGDVYASCTAEIGPDTLSYHDMNMHGITDADSIMGGGWTDSSNEWHQGTIQSFQSSANATYDVTSGGTMYSLVNFSFQPNHADGEGYFYGWVAAGSISVHFTWDGGDEMTVSEYVDGLLDNTHTIYATSPSYRFDYIKLVSESVSSGETVGMSLFGSGFDDYNWQNEKKELILSAILYE